MTVFDRFEPASLEPGLTQLSASSGPIRVLLVLDGPVRSLASDVRLRLSGGQVASARANRWDGIQALALAFLADGGRVEVTADPGLPSQGDGPALTTVLPEARTLAQDVTRLLAPLSGLGSSVRLAGAIDNQAPAVVMQVARLADGRRSVARILGDSGQELLMAARVLRRLHELGQLVVVGPDDEADPLLPPPKHAATEWTMPQSGWGETSKMPEADQEEFAGVRVSEDVQVWLSEEEAPPPLLDDAAFKQAFASIDLPKWGDEDGGQPVSDAPASDAPAAEAPETAEDSGADASERPPPAKHPPVAARMRAQVPVATGRPEAAPESTPEHHDDDEWMREAGVVSSNAPWVAAGVLVVVALLAAFFFYRPTDDPKPAPDAGLAIIEPPVLSSTTSTTSTSSVTDTATVAEDLPPDDALRPTIAAADAPEEVRRAESLLDGQNYGEAAKLLRRLRSTRPNDPVVFVLSGQVSVDSGRLSEAKRWANRAIALDRRSFRARVLKGSVDQFSNRDVAALKQYRRALELGPQHPMSSEIRSVVRELERRTGK